MQLPRFDELMREIVDSGQAVSPTAALRFAIYPATVAFPERLQDPRLKQDFPPKIYAEVQDEHEQQIDDLSSTLQQGKELQEQLEKLARESKRGDEMSWDKKKEMENLLEKQAQLEKQLEDTARELEETLRKAQEETFISPELLQKMEEISELIEAGARR